MRLAGEICVFTEYFFQCFLFIVKLATSVYVEIFVILVGYGEHS